MQDDGRRGVSKAEFVWVMSMLAKHDREKYRELRARGWEAVARAGISPKSENPN
jgi:hypothetical protein